MFTKMLVCTDLSSASDALIQGVGELTTIGMEEAVLPQESVHEATPHRMAAL